MSTDLKTPPSQTHGLAPRLRFQLDAREPAIEQMCELSKLTGLSFQCIDAHTGVLLTQTEQHLEFELPRSIRYGILSMPDSGKSQVFTFSSGLIVYVPALPELDGIPVVAVGCVLSGTNELSHLIHDRETTTAPNTTGSNAASPQSVLEFSEIANIADANHWSEQQVIDWLTQLKHCDADLLQNIINSATIAEAKQSDSRDEIDQLTEQVERAYGETSFFHGLTTQLQVSRSSIDVAELCLDRLSDFIPAAGSAIIMSPSNGHREVLTKGDLPFEAVEFFDILQQVEADRSRPIVRNQIAGSLLGERFPDLANFVLVEISDGTHDSGWIIACNSNQDFGPAEGNLLHSVATLLATHHRNRELYHELEDMLLQFTSSLVSTLDAKDPYTRGHSERVAQIAKRIAEELGLPEPDVEDIHQAGLLHDIGKIGVHDAVLQKEGKLTDAEFEHVKEHPVIGYRILKGMKRMKNVLPGVRHHHEDFAGTGYPDRLAGSEIPLMARILAVSDSYDAMRSDRPYRQGLPVERIEDIFRCGADQQWDPVIIEAYFRAREDIREIGNGGVADQSPDGE